ncbi:PKD domain-containing protein [Litoribacter populi]|uniref:PKD domain-containing protein n=1 Tax=Litoribacter populi TaxID=2598460 RepID=UPI001F37515F|nr:PKD domain-containing protein [Litoribacter populi]
MIKKYFKYLLLLLPFIALAACVEDYTLEANPPTEEDAQFSFQSTEENDNIIQFSASKEFFMMNWDFGNGAQSSGRNVTATYPMAGTYTVTLTVFNKGGSATFSQDVVIENTDPLLLDKPLYNMLTGGVDAPEGKTWVIDAARSGHFGVGPNPSSGAGDIPEWYQAGPFEKEGGGMYDDKYTFFLADFRYVMETNGNVYINAAQAGEFPGSFASEVGDYTAPYTAPDGLSWSMAEPEGSYPELTISNGGFIGYYAGGRTYQIVNIEENELSLRFVDQADNGLAWYIRLVPEGYDSGAEPEPEPEPDLGDVAITLGDLIGSGQKAWKLKPAAGAFGVGPNPGSDEWYPGGADISSERECLFNDLFIFGEGGYYEYDPQGDIYGEAYMGVDDGCQSVDNLQGTPGEAWGPGVHEFAFQQGTPESNPTITVTGTGAFIALPKAFNGGEYETGPPTANQSVTYTIIDYQEESEEMTITIDISGEGGIFWSFVLVPAE